jgi:hypothetical protein
MATNPSTRFYWKDWMNEAGLRLCSAAARGLWMDMLCIAAAATRKGYVEVESKACTVADLAKLANSPASSVRRWLAELEAHGVFSRDEDGTIFNRRMRRAPPLGPVRERNARQRQLFDNPEEKPQKPNSPLGHASTDSSSTSNLPSSPEAARARPEPEAEKHEKGNPEGGRVAPLGDWSGEIAANMRTPVGAVPAGVPTGDADASTSSSSATDCRGFGRKDQDQDNLAEGAASNDAALPGTAMAMGPHHDHGFSPGLAASRPSLGAVAVLASRLRQCDRKPKAPALKAQIRGQLAWKHVRFLSKRGEPGEAERYFALIDKHALVPPQELFDAVDHRMRAERWDDMRAWKRQNGIPCA